MPSPHVLPGTKSPSCIIRVISGQGHPFAQFKYLLCVFIVSVYCAHKDTRLHNCPGVGSSLLIPPREVEESDLGQIQSAESCSEHMFSTSVPLPLTSAARRDFFIPLKRQKKAPFPFQCDCQSCSISVL